MQEVSARRASLRGQAQRWVRRLTVLMLRLPDAPAGVTHRVGRGIHLLLRPAEGDVLHVTLMPRDRTDQGVVVTPTTTVRFAGAASLSPQAQRWMRALEIALRQVEREAGWTAFLDRADDAPAPAIAVTAAGGRNDQTSGTEAVVRLLEPCQARCAFCNFRGRQSDMVASLDDVDEHLQDARAAGARWVAFTGGEPTLVKELPEILSRAKDLGFERATIQTNGLKLAAPGYAARLKAAGLDAILQSLHSHVPALQDAIFKIPGAFDKGVAGIDAALDAGLIVGINHVTTTENLPGLGDFADWIVSRWGPRVYVTLSVMGPQGWGEDRLDLVPRLEVLRGPLAAALERLEAAGVSAFVPGVCGVPVCQLPDHARFFAEIHDPAPAESPSRRHVAACGDCGYRDRCSGYWTACLDAYGDQEIVAVPPQAAVRGTGPLGGGGAIPSGWGQSSRSSGTSSGSST